MGALSLKDAGKILTCDSVMAVDREGLVHK